MSERAPRLRDISIGLQAATPEWPGDTPYSCGWTWSIAEGATVNVSAFHASPHVGTHADAPLHVRDGWPGADMLPLEAFHGPALVLDVAACDPASPVSLATLDAAARDVGASLDGVERVLLRTGHTIASGTFPARWPVLAEAAVTALLARGLRLLGVDAPSVDDRESRTLPVHHRLFAGGAYNLENLDLRAIEPGAYGLVAFPLKLVGLDAAPVRAVLVEAVLP